MITCIKQSQEIMTDAVKELPYMLNCTADKMESCIRHGSSHGALLHGNGSTDIQERYVSEVSKHLNMVGTNPIILELHREYEGNIGVQHISRCS